MSKAKKCNELTRLRKTEKEGNTISEIRINYKLYKEEYIEVENLKRTLKKAKNKENNKNNKNKVKWF